MRIVTSIVFARPIRSPRMPKMIPPIAQPIMKIVVDVAGVRVDRGSPGLIALSQVHHRRLRARLKSCWSIVSNSQPSDATTSTNH